MSEHNYKFSDESLDLNQAHRYNLLIQVDSHSFSYAILEQKKLLAWAENCPLAELRNPQDFGDVMRADYGNVIVGLTATGFTLLPQTLMDDEYLANVARLLDVSETEQVYAQPFDQNNIIVFKALQDVIKLLPALAHQQVVHRAKGWISAIAANYPTSTDLYLNIENGVVELASFGFNKLRFYNCFAYKNHEELAYYTALVLKELELQPSEVTLSLSGDVSASDKSFTYLSEFFGKVKVNDARVADLNDQITSHKILSLVALSLCASSGAN